MDSGRSIQASSPPPRSTLGQRSRLTHDAEFQAVYDAKVRKTSGGLVVLAKPNDLGRPRLGLSVGKSVGGAVERNKVKRLIREAFRGMQHEIPRLGPRAYDFIVGARTARGMTLGHVRRTMEALIAEVHAVYERRARRAADKDGSA